jgi:Tol biopolymer transport system component
MWRSDGSGLIFSGSTAVTNGDRQLWALSYPAGEPRRITNDLDSYQGVSLTGDSHALVTVKEDTSSGIWVSPTGDTKNARMISSNTSDLDGLHGLAWTPEGRLVFNSSVNGEWNLWVMAADGSGPKQITVSNLGAAAPSVSPDRRTVVFQSTRTGNPNIWRIDADGGNPRQLSSGDADYIPQISPDGKWVVYTSNLSGLRVQKVPIEGGKPIQLTDEPSYDPAISPDGRIW